MGLVLGQSWMVVLINGRILFCPPIIMFTNTLSCKRASDGVSTWAMFDVNIKHGYPAICKSMSPL